MRDRAYQIIAELVGRDAADELVAALAEEGFIIIPSEDEITEYERERRS